MPYSLDRTDSFFSASLLMVSILDNKRQARFRRGRRQKMEPGRRAWWRGGTGGMGKPGVGGNWQAIAKATSCQDNAWGHRCPPFPTLMLIAFQRLWDNRSNNCFSCFNSGLWAANKRRDFVTHNHCKSVWCIVFRAFHRHFIVLNKSKLYLIQSTLWAVAVNLKREMFCRLQVVQ